MHLLINTSRILQLCTLYIIEKSQKCKRKLENFVTFRKNLKGKFPELSELYENFNQFKEFEIFSKTGKTVNFFLGRIVSFEIFKKFS